MADDVLVVFEQQVIRQFGQLLGLVDQRCVETVDVVLIKAFGRAFAQLKLLLERFQHG